MIFLRLLALLGVAVRVAYRAWGDSSDADPRPVLLLHGSPGSSRDFLALGPLLASGRRVIAPDLGGGFGGKQQPKYEPLVALMALKAGRPVPRLAYDYASHSRKETGGLLEPKPAVILEGILVLEEFLEEMMLILELKQMLNGVQKFIISKLIMVR